MQPRKRLLSLLVLAASGCVHVQDAQTCAVAGVLSAGGICSHLLTPETSDMTFEQFVAFLEADPATGKGAAICMSATDWNNMKTELEQACRELGNSCSLSTRRLLNKK